MQRIPQLRIAQACVEDVETSAARGIDKAMLRELGTCGWVREHQSVLISGPTAGARATSGVRSPKPPAGNDTECYTGASPDSSTNWRWANAERSFARALARLAKFEVLMLDDWGVGTLKEQQRQDLLDVTEDRYGMVSTLITGQLPISKWHEWIGDPTIADAILDRLVHNAFKVELKGHTRRRNKATASE